MLSRWRRLKNDHQDALLLALLLLWFASVLWTDAHSPWAFEHKNGSVTDNYFIALNAKNISDGKGWGLHNGVTFVPFEREISTGPVVFMPVVLAMQWIDDTDTARYLGTIVLHVLLLAWALKRLSVFMPSAAYRFLWLLLPVLFLPYMREQWYLVLGEVAACLLLLISASYVAETPTTTTGFWQRPALLSGLLAGAALMCKLISILCSPWIALCALFFWYAQGGVSNSIKNALQWAAAFTVIPALVAFWHWWGLGQSTENLLAYSKDYLSYYFGLGWTGDMESTFCAEASCLNANHRTAITSWMHSGGALWANLIQSVPLLVILLVILLLYQKQKHALLRFVLLIALMCSAQLFFFYFNGIHWQSRYYFIGGFLGTWALVLLLLHGVHRLAHQWPGKIHRRMSGLAVLVLLGLAVWGTAPWYRESGRAPAHADAVSVAQFINQQSNVERLLWVNRAPYPFPLVEYYLHADKGWRHYFGFIPEELEWGGGDPAAPGTVFHWLRPGAHYDVLQERWMENEHPADAACAEMLFGNDHYFVLRCDQDEVAAVLRQQFKLNISLR